MEIRNVGPRAASRVLCLLPGVPFPANTGGNVRALASMRALDAHFDTTFVAWHREGEQPMELQRTLRGRLVVLHRPARGDQVFAELESFVLGSPLGYSRYGWYPRTLRGLLAREKFDAIHFDHPHVALSLRQVIATQPQARLVLDAHNVEAEIAERLAPEAAPWLRPVLLFQARRIRALEQELARKCHLVLACSDKDAAAFRAMGARAVRVIPNSIPEVKAGARTQRRDLLFVGSLDWRPNADAALELAREIWPAVRARVPGARLVIVGRNPPPAVAALAGDDVIVAGSVPSVQPYLDSAFATAIPLRAGSGTRIKILEAWAAGVPVIATRVAAEGLPYHDGEDLLLAETRDEFGAAIARVHADEALRERLTRGGQRTVAPFTPEEIAARVAQVYRDELGLVAAEPPGSARRYSAA